MNSRALILFGALLASPAWTQEPNFDLSSDSIKKIVRDTAATQSRPIELSEEKPAEREPVETVRYVPPEKPLPPPVERAAPRPVAAPQSDGIFSGFLEAVVETLVNEALGDDDDFAPEVPSDRRFRCPAADPLETPEAGSSACPGIP
jgi:hypothetical protein